MDFLTFVDSINKIGIVFFIITLCALIYEIYLFRKEKTKHDVPKIPSFQDIDATKSHYTPITINTGEQQDVVKKPSFVPIILTIVFLLLFTGVSLFTFIKIRDSKAALPNFQAPQISYLKSAGIVLYDSEWNELSSQKQLQDLVPGEIIYAGIKLIPSVTTDQARIRINEGVWSKDHLTNKINKEKQVYYIPYTIKGDEKEFLIEAQLHTHDGGWPK